MPALRAERTMSILLARSTSSLPRSAATRMRRQPESSFVRGFDVIPTDCMAAVLKEALPDAIHLVLAFDARGPMSPGTARTMVRSLRPGKHGSRVRRNGVLEEVPLAQRWRNIDFEGGSATAIAIPWGDLATAWFSTGIPNIETYAAVPRATAIASRALNWVRPLLKSAPGQALLHRLANRTSGPSEEQLRSGRSRLWGEVRNGQASCAQRSWRRPTATV